MRTLELRPEKSLCKRRTGCEMGWLFSGGPWRVPRPREQNSNGKRNPLVLVVELRSHQGNTYDQAKREALACAKCLLVWKESVVPIITVLRHHRVSLCFQPKAMNQLQPCLFFFFSFLPPLVQVIKPRTSCHEL